jgi:hypothetical protein
MSLNQIGLDGAATRINQCCLAFNAWPCVAGIVFTSLVIPLFSIPAGVGCDLKQSDSFLMNEKKPFITYATPFAADIVMGLALVLL